MDRLRNWVIEDALKQYIEQQARYVESIEQAMACLERGEGITHEALMAEMDALIEEKARAARSREMKVIWSLRDAPAMVRPSKGALHDPPFCSDPSYCYCWARGLCTRTSYAGEAPPATPPVAW
jgi:predicted transcriptional regulator